MSPLWAPRVCDLLPPSTLSPPLSISTPILALPSLYELSVRGLQSTSMSWRTWGTLLKCFHSVSFFFVRELEWVICDHIVLFHTTATVWYSGDTVADPGFWKGWFALFGARRVEKFFAWPCPLLVKLRPLNLQSILSACTRTKSKLVLL